MWRGTDRGIQAREYGSRRCCANSALSVMSSREGLSSGIELTPATGRLTRIETNVWGTLQSAHGCTAIVVTRVEFAHAVIQPPVGKR